MFAIISFQKKNWHVALVLALLLATLVTTAVPAMGGALDPNFGDDGRVITDFDGDSDAAWALTIQPDGKILVVGNSMGDNSNMVLTRYNSDGSLDTSFSDDGKVLSPFGGSSSGINLMAVALQPDGKILVGGRVYLDTGTDMGLARFNSDGSLDISFGNNGKVITDIGASEAITSLVILPDGRIVAAGSSLCSMDCFFPIASFALARYNSDGSLDTTFGTDGYVLHFIGTHPSWITKAVVQPDGKIVVTGGSYNTREDTDFTLARYNSDGSLDLSFGREGIVQTDFGGSFENSDGMVLQPDGRLIVAGTRVASGNSDFALARYNSDGSLDVTFGSYGRVLTDMGGSRDGARAIALYPDGRIVVAGFSDTGPEVDAMDFALARYTSDGSLDTGFGTNGRAITDFGKRDMATSVALQPDGKVVVAGFSGREAPDFALARYLDTVFADVLTEHWAWSYVERLHAAGITDGCGISPRVYCPESRVTRAQMAVFLLRGIYGFSYSPPVVGASTGLDDVATDYWAAAWIKQLAVEGITAGCGNGNYCPDVSVTRAQMAVFLLRSKYGASYSPPVAGSSTGFSDVQRNYWAAAWIKQLAVEGITAGCGNGNYCPDVSVTRAEMAVLLVKTFNLP